MLEEEKNDEIGLKVDEEVNDVHKDLSKGQKIAAAVLGFFAFFIVIVWALQFKNSFISPLAYKAELEKIKQSQEGGVIESELCPSGTCFDLDEEALKTKDTDGDGLWDYDELNFYGTSPYLEDSDSDGFSDSEEVESGNNPNCPAGRTCSASYETGSSGEAKIDDFFSETALDEADFENFDFDQLDALLEQAESGTFNEAGSEEGNELRRILSESGVGDDVLDLFSDEELMQIYAEALQGQ